MKLTPEFLAGVGGYDKPGDKVYAVKLDETKGSVTEPQPEPTAAAQEAAKYLGCEIVETLEQALARRGNKEKVITRREADTLSRLLGYENVEREVPTFLWAAMHHYTGFISEGVPELNDNPWVLRERINNGLHWYKFERKSANDQARYKGDKLLELLIKKLTGMGLAPTPDELANGFARELLKPEHLTWEQWDTLKHELKLNMGMSLEELLAEQEG